MPQIPTYTADLASQRGLRGVVQAEIDVGAAVRPYTALGNVAESIGRTGLAIADIAEQRNKEKELRWAGDNADALTRTLIEWQKENQGREDIGDAYREFADRKLSEYEAQAPTPRAAQTFLRSVRPGINSDWERNLRIGEATRLENFRTAETKSSITANEIYREQAGLASVYSALKSVGYDLDASKETRRMALQSQLARIETAYGKAAPKLAAQMREAAQVDAIVGAAEVDTQFARELLDKAAIDPDKRRILLHQIDTAQNTRDVVAQVEFADALEKSLSAAEATGVPAALPSEQAFISVYGKDAGSRHHAVAKEKFRTTNLAIGTWNTIKDQAGRYQVATVESLADKGEKDAAQKLSSKVAESIRAQNGPNVMAHIRENYETVAQAYKHAETATTPEEKATRTKAANDIALQYQGIAPVGVLKPGEEKKYLGHATGRFHLLSESQADQMGAEMNAMSAEDLMGFMAGLAAQYPDSRQRNIVYNDLVTVPKEGNRLKAGIQFGMMIPSDALRRQYLQVVQHSKAVTALTTEKRQEFETALEAEGDWLKLQSALGGGIQTPELAEFRNAVVHYAYALSQDQKRGLDAEGATEQAVKDIISGSWGFVKVKGVEVGIQRMRDDFGMKPVRTDMDMAYLERVLNRGLSEFPVEELSNLSGFPLANAIQDPAKRVDYVRDIIQSNGFFVTEADGQGATVYVRDDRTGTAHQLVDKKGKPFLIQYDQAAEFLPMQVGLLGVSGFQNTRGTPRTIQVPRHINSRSYWENLR